jgi:hypothetical protein
MVIPMILAVVLASLHLYPLKERAALYLLPFLVLPIAAVWDEAVCRRDWFGKLCAGVLLAVSLIGHLAGFGQVEVRADIKPVIRQLVRQAEDGDWVYVYWRPRRVIESYDRWELGPELLDDPRLEVVRGTAHIDEPLAYLDVVGDLTGRPRVWFLFSRPYDERGLDEVEIFRRAFEQRGRLLSTIRAADAGAWLYDHSEGP